MTQRRPYPTPTQLLSSVSVRDLLAQKPTQLFGIAPQDTVYHAVAMMADAEVGALVVLHDERLVGIISERDYARQIILRGRRSQDTLVEEIMTRRVFTVTLEQTIQDCMRIMTDQQIRHLPVVDGGRVVAMVSVGDVVRAVLEEQSRVIDELSRYVSGEPRVTSTSI
ncbi:MAG: CBS domain-containing protein [Polyangiaceae bacterium]